MMGVTRQNKTERVIILVESEKDHPEDGFRWRKYGMKNLKGNTNPRKYYRCTYTGCKVKKHVQRSADDVKLVVATYNGLHEHVPPPERIIKSGTNNKFGSSMSQSGRTPFSLSGSQIFPSPLAPQLDMTEYYIAGLSVLPILPVNKNHGVMNRDDEPKIDRVIPTVQRSSRG
ncbi:unnamed protein product [Eruca vesicaria subsp. sativa]|uniref:WRKY domain-containing protein n=1 Tax=Eruca vesicaria subsp. sativa TaxID=29727 RepID=A0ABC8KBY6_ERUVS|nr:unnamed protein product [Eruca vesicaria subsp. sativa]